MPQERMPKNKESFIITMAIMADLIGLSDLVPIIGNIVARVFWVFTWLGLFLWFKMNGATSEELAPLFFGGGVEAIPFLGALPLWFVATSRICNKMEEADKKARDEYSRMEEKNRQTIVAEEEQDLELVNA